MTQVYLLYNRGDLSLTHAKNVGTRLEPQCYRDSDSWILGMCWPVTPDSGWAPGFPRDPVWSRRSGKNYGRNPKSASDFHTHRGTCIQIHVYLITHLSEKLLHANKAWKPWKLSFVASREFGSFSYRKVNIGIPIPIARAPAQSCIWFGDLLLHRCSLEDVCTLDNLKTNYPNLAETKVVSFSNEWMTNGILVNKSNGITCINEKVSFRAMSRPGWSFN